MAIKCSYCGRKNEESNTICTGCFATLKNNVSKEVKTGKPKSDGSQIKAENDTTKEEK